MELKHSVIVGMSGGVDSSVAALLLKEQGYSVMGVTMKLYYNEDIGVAREKTCCSLSDIEDARDVAATLGIPYYVFNFSDDFEQHVIADFVDQYEEGRTPNPCVECNRYLKFDRLLARGIELGYDHVATGHYARIEQDPETGRYLLKKALDASKDQTYMLYELTQGQLGRALFPLGGLTKPQVRKIAEDHGLINSRKRDSQDICFVQNGSYADFIERYTGKKWPEGNFVTEDGKVLGTHKGVIRYTIGQRKGLGLALPEPMYVKRIDLVRNQVVLGRDSDLYSSVMTVEHLNLIPVDRLERPIRAMIKARYSAKAQPGTVEQTGDDQLTVTFDQPQRALTSGQSAVIYDGDTVIGGGKIK